MYSGECAPDNPETLNAVQSRGEVKPKQTRAKTRAMVPEDFEQSVLYRTTDTQDWMFDRQQFLEIANQYGPFTVDMCSDNDGANSHCKKFLCPEDSALEANLEGETVWGNVPFTDQTGEFLRHFIRCQQRAPTTTAGAFVLPRWEHAEWWPLTENWVIIREYAAGTDLFTAPPAREGESRRPLGPIKWPAVVFWSPAGPGTGNTTDGRMGNNISTKGHPDQFPYQSLTNPGPRISTTGQNSAVNQLLIIKGQCEGYPARILIDSGASADFVATSFIGDRRLLTQQPLSRKSSRQVKLANGLLQRSSREIVAQLRYGNYKESRTLLVTDLEGYDIILGQP